MITSQLRACLGLETGVPLSSVHGAVSILYTLGHTQDGEEQVGVVFPKPLEDKQGHQDHSLLGCLHNSKATLKGSQ